MPEFYVVSADSGTFFYSDTTLLVDENDLTAEDILILSEGSDQERINLAERIGRPLHEFIHD